MRRHSQLTTALHFLLLFLLILFEKFYLGAHIFSLVKSSNDSALANFLYEYGKSISRITTLTGFFIFVFILPKFRFYVDRYTERYSPQILMVLPGQLILAVALFFTSSWFFTGAEASYLAQASWVALLAAYIAATVFCFFTPAFLSYFLRQEKYRLLIALTLAAFVWWLSVSVQGLWGGFSNATFSAVAGLLLSLGFGDQLYVAASEKVIGINDFLVNVAPSCSGYEGMALISAFASIYLYTFRRDFKFPQAIVIIPIGVVLMWCFNVLRIALLVIIGAFWSSDIAVWGFHTQAGWISFILVSLGILAILHRLDFFSRSQPTERRVATGMNLPVATLIPLIVLLASTLLTQAFSGVFVWSYPLRVLATAGAIVYCFRYLDLKPLRVTPVALFGGLLVALLWLALVSPDPDLDHQFVQTLSSVPEIYAGIWVLFRFVGATVTVPIAEELGFRAYLLCKLSSVEIRTRGKLAFSLVGCLGSSVAFGLLHGDWLAGTLAGLVYAGVRYKSTHILDAIAAHGVTNALIFLYAALTGYWSII